MGELVDLAVPVNPNGTYVEHGPGGRTWGLTRVGGGRWQVNPSIDVKQGPDAPVFAPGAEARSSGTIWHQTPVLVGVPDGEAWQG